MPSRHMIELEVDVGTTLMERPGPAQLSRAQYDELRNELERDLRRALRGRLPSGASDGAESTVRQAIETLDPRERQQALQVLDALGRMRMGTYGSCTVCREPIPYGRLLAIPETTLCVSCGRTRVP